VTLWIPGRDNVFRVVQVYFDENKNNLFWPITTRLDDTNYQSQLLAFSEEGFIPNCLILTG